MFGVVKRHQSQRKRPSITTRNTAFCNTHNDSMARKRLSCGIQPDIPHTTSQPVTLCTKVQKAWLFALKHGQNSPETDYFQIKIKKNIDKILQKRKIAVSLHSLTTSKGA